MKRGVVDERVTHRLYQRPLRSLSFGEIRTIWRAGRTLRCRRRVVLLPDDAAASYRSRA